MSFFIKALLAVVVGTALGLWTTQAAVNRGFLFGAVSSGPWVAFPTVGSPAVDPYARAVLARTAYLPVGADEGVAFLARTDGAGRVLSGACEYAIESSDIAARFWSVSLFDREGRRVPNAADRFALTSQDVVRLARKVRIVVSPTVEPGNWLPSPEGKTFVLLLTLYQSNSGTAVAAAAEANLPTLVRGACRT